jgi:hypothetical protein
MVCSVVSMERKLAVVIPMVHREKGEGKEGKMLAAGLVGEKLGFGAGACLKGRGRSRCGVVEVVVWGYVGHGRRSTLPS